MIDHKLCLFVDYILEQNKMTSGDVTTLLSHILPEGLTCEDEADVLIALDRAIPDTAPEWGEALNALVTDHAVWGMRPTGYIDASKAHWLVSSFESGSGPTRNALKCAFEIVKSAQASHELLIGFIMRARQSHSSEAMLLELDTIVAA